MEPALASNAKYVLLHFFALLDVFGVLCLLLPLSLLGLNVRPPPVLPAADLAAIAVVGPADHLADLVPPEVGRLGAQDDEGELNAELLVLVEAGEAWAGGGCYARLAAHDVAS